MQDLPPGFRLEPLPAPPANDGLPPGFRLEPVAPAPRRAAAAPVRRRNAAPVVAPAVDEASEPLIRDVQTTAAGTTYTVRPLAPGDTPESLAAEGREFNPVTNTWEFPRGLEDVEVQGSRPEMLPMVRPPAAGGPLEQAGAAVVDAYRANPVTRQFLNFGSGVARGVQRVAGGAYGLLGQAADRLGLDGIGNAMIDQADAYQARANEMNAPQRADNLLLNQTGQFAGEVAATAPVAGVVGRGIVAGGQGVARVAPGVGRVIERVGQATQAGGFLPSAVRPPAAGAAPAIGERLGNLALRGSGGAISGSTQAALIDEEDAAAGATIGALLPTIAARPAKWALNRVLAGYEALTGQMGRTRAAEIVRQSLGVDYDVAVTALRNAAPDVTAQQALVDAGVEPSAFMGVGAAVRGANPDPYLAIEAAQRTARQAPIDRLAGGANLTDAQMAARAEKEALRAATVPMQRAELAAADASGVLDVAPVSAALMQQADAPGVGTTNSRVLAEIAAGLDALAARRGGVASADDLYAFRKDDLDDIISRSLSGQRGGDITSQAARRSELVGSAQRMLDDAIEAAGGTGWRQYLEAYSSGSRGIERQNLMGVAGRQLRQSPNAFANLVAGDTPDVVSGVFGGNRIDLRNLMNPTGVGPSGMDALDDAARQIRRDERIGVLAGEGRGVARELLSQGDRGPFRRARNLLSFGRPVTAAAMEFGSMLVDAKVAPQIRRELARAYQSGANMDELLAMVPLATRAQMARNMMNPAFWSHLTGGATNVMADPPSNAMSPPAQ